MTEPTDGEKPPNGGESTGRHRVPLVAPDDLPQLPASVLVAPLMRQMVWLMALAIALVVGTATALGWIDGRIEQRVAPVASDVRELRGEVKEMSGDLRSLADDLRRGGP